MSEEGLPHKEVTVTLKKERRKKPRFRHLYSFSRIKPSSDEDESQIGGPGFGRVVFVNDPDSHEARKLAYTSNYVSTTKYNLATFIPKSLFQQFRRVANIYFLIAALLAFTPLSPFSAISAVLPLVFVLGATMVKEAIEDWRRFLQDREANNQKTRVHCGDGTFNDTEWKKVRVGDVVKVEKDENFPADLILLSSSNDDTNCYVETMNLDGETNLKSKQALEVTSSLHTDSSFKNFKAIIKCEDPNANLYSFIGTMDFDGQKHSLSPQQLLLRGSKLRNTDFVYGVVIFTGHDTKVMQNSTDPPFKRSKIELKMDKIIYLLLVALVLISTIGAVIFGIMTSKDLEDGKMRRWYLRPDNTTLLFDPERAPAAAALDFLTFMTLYGYFIPISLYVSIEIVKVLQSVFINQDIEMYYEDTDMPAHARTSSLNEELGQVDTILCDKTGTLTCNSMEFVKCSIAGTAYGSGVTQVEQAMARVKGSSSNQESENRDSADNADDRHKVKGFNFKDERIMNGNWVNEPHSDAIQKFFQVLAICHTAIPEEDEESGDISYEAESPDEDALVIAARELGFKFYQRTQTSISLHELDPTSGNSVERSYDLLNILEFNSSRKRMSVIVRNEEGKLLLLSKGADSVMFERLASSGRSFEEGTKTHTKEYADAGLRTLIVAYRELDKQEYEDFNKEFSEAKSLVSADRDEKVDEVADKIEKDLILLGAAAIEDKLQNGVPECIQKLEKAGISVWVLTGDKMETAINIGYACNLLREDMEKIIINLDTPEMKTLEKEENKDEIAKVSKKSVVNQIREGKMSLESSNTEYALIIDGKSLEHALEDDIKMLFLDLATSCVSVIFCRSSPKQKARVAKLVKFGGKVTLAVGDGANDVGMLQEADIGIGISGPEGMQAVMNSDIAIAQFRFLERLLLVHGHWCYRRISSMICYFFYKNIAFGVTIFLYEAYASFSGQSAYNDWYLSTYNVFFTSLPVIALGVFDQDVSAQFCLKFPLLYQVGVQNILFTWRRILGWMGIGIVNAVTIFFFCIKLFEHQAFRKGGEVVDLGMFGAAMYTCVVWIVNCQLALAINYFTLIQHIFIWGSIALWYVFMVVYGYIPPTISTNGFMVFTEGLAPAPFFWISTLFVTVATLIPYFTYRVLRRQSFPGYHEILQQMWAEGKSDDPDNMRPGNSAWLGITLGGSRRRAPDSDQEAQQPLLSR